MTENFLTVEQAARRLQITPYTLRAWLKAGKLRAIKLGREWRISERVLAELGNEAAPGLTQSATSQNRAALFAAPRPDEIAARRAALKKLGAAAKDNRAAALPPLDLSGERADVYGYVERENTRP